MGKRVAFITGASSGIGRATALEFAAAGYAVVISYLRSRSPAAELVSSIEASGGVALALQADASDEAQVDRSFGAIEERFGRLDVLVNNAGDLVAREKVETMDLELFRRIMDLNFTSVFLSSRQAIPLLRRSDRGRIVNVSSVAAHNGGGIGASVYAAAKGAVAVFTKGLAKELAPLGILVNAIAPGIIDTRFHDMHSTPEARKANLSAIPIGREGTPAECGRVALFLAGEAASYLTGEMIEVNGGMFMD